MISLFASRPPFIRDILLAVTAILLVGPIPSPAAAAAKSHVIMFRSPDLYPEGMAWDPHGEHFLVGSVRSSTIHSVSDAGVTQTVVSDPDLPENATILGLAVDSVNRRLLAAVHSAPPLPPFNALAAYDLRQDGRRIFLSLLPSEDGSGGRDVANDVAVDYKGRAFVTNSAKNLIWKVDSQGQASIFSRSPLFSSQPVFDPDSPFSDCGLNGIVYVSKGYLLVVQSNTGKMFKVDEETGTARLVPLSETLRWADGMAVRSDGVVLVVSHHTLWFLKSHDSWGEGLIYDKTALDKEGFATSVAVGGEDRAYVLYGRVVEGLMRGAEGGREWFGIEEVRSKKESEEDMVWVFVLVGLGLAYFLYWRFQMKQLITGMDRKTN